VKVELLGIKELIVSETKKSNVSFIKLIPEVESKEYVNHHILLADVSGSMHYNIKMLQEKIRVTMESLLEIPNSYVSIITYSGHTQSKRILNAIKCDEVSYKMSNVYNVIEKELYTKGVTVMSEPLEDAISICKSLAGICDKHHIALFTDGCLVTWNWSEEKEREKCFNVAQICNKEGIFLNAIGFGQYYDRRFLKELIEVAGNGQLIHIDYVKDYAEVILDAIKKVNAENVQTVKLEVKSGSIFNISNSLLKQQMNVNVNPNNVIAIIDTNKIIIDEVSRDLVVSNLKTPDDNIVDDFYYSLSRMYLLEEDIDNFEFIIKYLGDVDLFSRTQNCYSFLEKGDASNKITEALNDTSKRFLGGRNQIIETTATEKICLLEILQLIMEDDESALYWDLETPYHRVTQASISVEDSIKFNRQKTGLVPVTSLSVGSEKLNIGIKVKVNGTVNDEISGYEKESCIYRDYNLVNGGNVNVPYINVCLSPQLFIVFWEAGLLNKEICDNTGVQIDENKWVFKIALDGIKSANKRLLKSMTMTEIKDSLKEIADLKCKQWAYNQIIKDVVGDKEKVDLLNLSFEEQEIRKLLRIDENGIYQPLKVEKDNTTPFEIYPAVYMTWDITQFPEKAKKQEYLDSIKNVIKDLGYKIGTDDVEIYKLLSDKLNIIRKEMREKEFRINCVRIASALMNKSPFIWEVQLEKDKKTTDKVLNRNMVVGGKINISKKTVDDDVIEQKRWVLLVKAN
jgi:hypothetical protein